MDTYKAWSNKVFIPKSTAAITMANRVNVFALAPLAVVLFFGFLTGCKCTKNLAMLHSAAMLYSMVVMFCAGHDALLKSKESGHHAVGDFDSWTLFTSVIGFYLFFPVAVILRTWSDQPFRKCTPGTKCNGLSCLLSCTIKLLMFAWFLFALVACYEFTQKNVQSASHLPSVVDTARTNWPQVQEYVDLYAKHVKEYGVAAATGASQMFQNLGDTIHETVKSYTEGEKK